LFIAGQLDAAASAIRGIYLRRGYAQVKVDSCRERAGSPPRRVKAAMRPVIVICRGARLLRIGEITFTGNTAFEAVR
jgi:outer membrane protein assembly factor BamA